MSLQRLHNFAGAILLLAIAITATARGQAITVFVSADNEGAALPCRTCSITPVCGGGCPKLWLDTGRGCPSMRRTVRARVDLAAEVAGFVPTTVQVEGLRGT